MELTEEEEERQDNERRVMAKSLTDPGFQLLMKKIQEAADTYPLEMAKMRLKGQHSDADALLAVWNGFKFIMPQKIEAIVNAAPDKTFTFKNWLKRIVG
jgi:hypothetical protein